MLRRNDTAEVEARYTLETDEGALLYIDHRGYRLGPLDVMCRLGAGERVDPSEYSFYTTPRFETGAAKYD